MGQVYAYRNQRKMSEWPTEQCNRISGSDGLQFPPKSVNDHERLDFFVPFYCRPLSLVFDKEVWIFCVMEAPGIFMSFLLF
jgi:hypothetical protein